MAYVIVDVVKRALEAPDTFNIPIQAARERLKVGMLAKLVFEIDKPVSGCTGERMWVKVASIDPNLKLKYAGELVNTPVVVEGLKPGDAVEFGPEHVADFSAEGV